jgi:hypothetical protein
VLRGPQRDPGPGERRTAGAAGAALAVRGPTVQAPDVPDPGVQAPGVQAPDVQAPDVVFAFS